MLSERSLVRRQPAAVHPGRRGSAARARHGVAERARGRTLRHLLERRRPGRRWRASRRSRYGLDTTLLKDGPHRVSAEASGLYDGQSDYVWLRVDNTAPAVSGGTRRSSSPSVTRPSCSPGATDANGIASVSVNFGDGATGTQASGQIGQPIRHVYAKAGTFTETVTATDAAGNIASATRDDPRDQQALRAGRRQAARRRFTQATKLKKRKNLSVKFTVAHGGRAARAGAQQRGQGARLVEPPVRRGEREGDADREDEEVGEGPLHGRPAVRRRRAARRARSSGRSLRIRDRRGAGRPGRESARPQLRRHALPRRAAARSCRRTTARTGRASSRVRPRAAPRRPGGSASTGCRSRG